MKQGIREAEYVTLPGRYAGWSASSSYFFVGVIVTPALLKSLDQACELLRDPKPEHLAAKPDTLADIQKLLNARHYQLECSKNHFNSKLFCPTCNESMDGRFARNRKPRADPVLVSKSIISRSWSSPESLTRSTHSVEGSPSLHERGWKRYNRDIDRR